VSGGDHDDDSIGPASRQWRFKEKTGAGGFFVRDFKGGGKQNRKGI
jgi:hypothetical protein